MTPLLIPFLIGLFSAFHCIGMCGGIITALTIGLPRKVRDARAQLLLSLLLYNLGRIGSYALAGAAAGGVLGGVVDAVGPQHGLSVLQRMAAVALIVIGMHLAGWLPQLSRIEQLGVPLWRRIEPLAQRLLPFDAPWKLFLYGALWGWIPCGMVYTMLTSASVQGGAINAALYMAAFGAGTLLPVASTGLMAASLRRWMGAPQVRRVFGLLVIAWGGLTLLHPDFAERLHHDGHDGQAEAEVPAYCKSP